MPGMKARIICPKSSNWPKNRAYAWKLWPTALRRCAAPIAKGRKIYTNRDVLVNADFATYLPVWEGFGNALLEAWAARLLTVVSTYLVYKTDIRTIAPRGVELVDRYDEDGNLIIPERALEDLERILQNPKIKETIVNHNFDMAQKAFSLETLKNILDNIFIDYGDEIRASRRRMKRAGYIFSV